MTEKKQKKETVEKPTPAKAAKTVKLMKTLCLSAKGQ